MIRSHLMTNVVQKTMKLKIVDKIVQVTICLCHEQTPCCSALTMSLCVFLCVAEWHLTDSPAGCVVDTIKEPSNVAEGDLTSSPPTHSATLRFSLSCDLKSFTNHVNKYPRLSIMWFFTPKYKELYAFVVATKIQDNLGECQKHVKNICSHKERPIGINSVACGKGHRECVCVCE